ncbi:hypothetical protein P8839_11955 [Bacillus spizizenii]|nr:hypothetical protein [Bacillus spizizenii]
MPGKKRLLSRYIVEPHITFLAEELEQLAKELHEKMDQFTI